jgi:hypothetical protein
MEDFPDVYGPAMDALGDDRRRRFAWLVASGMNQSAAAREAGYSDHLEGAKVRGCLLMQNPKVLAAVEECSRKFLRGLAPLAIDAARNILANPRHPYHGRMIETVLDRSGHSAKTEHKVTVEHVADMRSLEELARRMAGQLGVDEARLIGGNVIEGEVVERAAGRSEAADGE